VLRWIFHDEVLGSPFLFTFTKLHENFQDFIEKNKMWRNMKARSLYSTQENDMPSRNENENGKGEKEELFIFDTAGKSAWRKLNDQ
jgi:hypothetical protein